MFLKLKEIRQTYLKTKRILLKQRQYYSLSQLHYIYHQQYHFLCIYYVVVQNFSITQWEKINIPNFQEYSLVETILIQINRQKSRQIYIKNVIRLILRLTIVRKTCWVLKFGTSTHTASVWAREANLA